MNRLLTNSYVLTYVVFLMFFVRFIASIKLILLQLAACLFPLLLSCSVAATQAQQNVVFIIVDDLNDWLGAYQPHSPSHTPNIDELARRGVSFVNAHTSAPICAASRASLMSGVLPHKSGFYTNGNHDTNPHKVINKGPHLAQLFRQQGYQVLAGGKIYHRWVSDGGDEQSEKMYDRYMPHADVMPLPRMLADGEGYGGKEGNKFYPFPSGGTELGRKLGIKKGVSLTAGIVQPQDLNKGKMPDELIAQWGQAQLHALAYEQQTQADAKPFFLTLGFLRPHAPYAVPKKYFDRFPLGQIELPTVDDMQDIPLYGKAMTMGSIPGGDHKAVLALGENYWKKLIQGYLASINFVDEQVGKVLHTLQQTGLDKNTLVVLTSDHGQNLGQKMNWRKMSLWQESTKVPLIIHQTSNKYPGAKVTAAVSLLDIYPTLVGSLGFPQQAHTDGNDLSALITNPQLEWQKPILIAWQYQNFAVRDNRYLYIRYRDGSEELYDHVTDPLELHNVAASLQLSNIKAKLQDYLPDHVALPVGVKQWQGDKLDKYVNSWQKDGLPQWFKSAVSE